MVTINIEIKVPDTPACELSALKAKLAAVAREMTGCAVDEPQVVSTEKHTYGLSDEEMDAIMREREEYDRAHGIATPTEFDNDTEEQTEQEQVYVDSHSRELTDEEMDEVLKDCEPYDESKCDELTEEEMHQIAVTRKVFPKGLLKWL